MPKYELSISADYVKSWGKVEAVRELFQNALDEQVSDPANTLFFEYSPSEKIMRIGNKNSTLDIQTLLIGVTSKQDSSKYIGQHGEGYKVATVVLLREGCDVTFYNYNAREIWSPRLVKSRRYNGALVPTFFVEKQAFWKAAPEASLIIEIRGISEDDYEAIKASNLHLQGDTYEVIKTNYGDMLLSPQHAKKIFVSGLFVRSVDTLTYGYNLRPCDVNLDRDRRMIDMISLLFKTGSIIVNTNDRELMKKCAKIEDGRYMHYNCGSTRVVSEALYEDFSIKYGAKAIPVTSQKEAEEIRSTGYEPVFVSDNEKCLIEPVLQEKIEIPTILTWSEKMVAWFEKYADELEETNTTMYEELKQLIDTIDD